MSPIRFPSMRITRSLPALAAVCVLAALTTAQTPEDAAVSRPPLSTASLAATQSADALPAVMQAKDLKGKDVLDDAGAVLGSVTDLAFADDGGVIVVLRRPDAALTGVPLDQLQPALQPVPKEEPSDGLRPLRDFTARASRASIEGAPALTSVEHIDTDWIRRVRAHYAGAPADAAPTGGLPEGSTGEAPMDPPAAATPVAQDTAHVEAAERIPCLGAVVGTGIENTKGEELGTLTGIAVNMPDSTVAYAIIEVEHGLLGFDARHHGIAWDALKLDLAKKTATVALDRKQLEDTPGIDMKALPSRPDLRVQAQQPVSLRER